MARAVQETREEVVWQRETLQEALEKVEYSVMHSEDVRSALEQAIQDSLQQSARFTQQQMLELAAEMTQKVQGATMVQSSQAQIVDAQNKEIAQLKIQMVEQKMDHQSNMKQMEQIHAQQTVQLKKEMDDLQSQIAQMQLQRGVEVSQTGAAQIQATQERQEMTQQQQQMATSVQQLAHEIRALKEDLTRSENARQDLENLVRAQATQSREPVYENEGSLRSKPIPISMTEKRGHEDFQSGAPQGLNSIFSAPPAGASTSNQPMATVPLAPAFSFTRAPPLSSAARRRTNGPPIQPTQPQTNISTTPLAMGNPFPPVQIKPKDPPSFKGALDEDVSAWLQTLDDFQWFTRMTDEQIYGYAVMQL